MSKKKTAWVAVALVLASVTGVCAAPAIAEKIAYATAEIQPGSLTVKNNAALRQIVKEKKAGTDVQVDVEAYAHFLADLYPTEEEIRYIDSLIGKGYDAKAVVEIYEFWQDTQEDIAIIEAVYEYLPPVEGVKYWVDEAFIKLAAQGKTKGQYSDLSVEEVNALYESGVSYEEILMADKLSRYGTKDIHHVLSRKQEDASWYEILDEVYTLSSPESKQENIEKYKQIQNPHEILASIRLAKEGDMILDEALDGVIRGESSSKRLDEKKVEKGKKIKENYITQGLWDTSGESKEWGHR